MENRKETVTDRLNKADDAQKTVIEQGKQDMKTVPTVETILNTPVNISPVEERLLTKAIEVKPYKYMDLTLKQQSSIRKDNVHNFHKQICHNLTIGAKALYLVCRDIRQASVSLQADEYVVLKNTLPLSDSTISKYITIAESEVCRKLFMDGRLPESWTTMYEIAKIEDKDLKEKVFKSANIKTTAEQVKTIIGKVASNVKKAFTKLFDFSTLDKPKDFIKVAVESNKEFGTVDPNALLMIKEKVEKAVASAIVDYEKELKVSNYKLDKSLIAEVVADETLIAKSRESILRYFKKYKYSLFTSRFIGKFNDLSGVQLTQSTK